MLNRMLLFKLKPGTSKEQVESLRKNLTGLKNEIPGIISVSGGANTSPEGKEKGFTEGFVIEFSDSKSRDEYIPHPAHKRVVENHIIPIIDDVLVFDYEK